MNMDFFPAGGGAEARRKKYCSHRCQQNRVYTPYGRLQNQQTGNIKQCFFYLPKKCMYMYIVIQIKV